MGSGPVKPRSSGSAPSSSSPSSSSPLWPLSGASPLGGDPRRSARRRPAAQIERLKATVLSSRTCRSSTSWTCTECANLTYHGDFIDGDPEDCGGSTGRSVQFDDVGRADHQLIKDALAASGHIERVGGRFLSDGRVRYAWFLDPPRRALRDVVVAWSTTPRARARRGLREW